MHACKNISFIEKYQNNMAWTFKQNREIDTVRLYPTPPSFNAGMNEWMNESINQSINQYCIYEHKESTNWN